jgi:hypothetical protein
MSTISPIEFKEVIRQRDVLHDAIKNVVNDTHNPVARRGFLAAALVKANPPPEFIKEMRREPFPSTHPMTGNQCLRIPVGDDWAAVIPFPMSAEDYELLLETLKLWKRKLVVTPQQVEGLK